MRAVDLISTSFALCVTPFCTTAAGNWGIRYSYVHRILHTFVWFSTGCTAMLQAICRALARFSLLVALRLVLPLSRPRTIRLPDHTSTECLFFWHFLLVGSLATSARGPLDSRFVGFRHKQVARRIHWCVLLLQQPFWGNVLVETCTFWDRGKRKYCMRESSLRRHFSYVLYQFLLWDTSSSSATTPPMDARSTPLLLARF